MNSMPLRGKNPQRLIRIFFLHWSLFSHSSVMRTAMKSSPGAIQKAATPQEERRYLFSLATFRQTDLLDRTLAMTLNGEIRLQDAPFMVSAVMSNVYGREQGWRFVKTNWDVLDRRFPKQGLRRMCGGITGLCKPELERDVREFFQARNVDLGGKTLEQYLEQLRIGVSFGERSRRDLQEFLGKGQYSPDFAQTSFPG